MERKTQVTECARDSTLPIVQVTKTLRKKRWGEQKPVLVPQL